MNAHEPETPEIFNDPERMKAAQRSIQHRQLINTVFKNICMSVAGISVVLLLVLLTAIFYLGYETLTLPFLSSPPSPDASTAGFFPAIMGSVWLLVLVMALALPVGVATAITLEEFKPGNRSLRNVHSVLQTNITNLAGVPSVVYGMIGLTLFVSMFQVFGNEKKPAFEWGVRYFDQFYSDSDQIWLVPVDASDTPETIPHSSMVAFTPNGKKVDLNIIGPEAQWPEGASLSDRTLREDSIPGRIHERSWYYFRIPFGRGVLSGALTLMLVILPIIMTASQEALRAVPYNLREAAWGMGATRWQTVWKITLPSAVPGIMTGTILALSRAIGEAAPLLMIAGIVFISNPPGNIMDDFTAMPLQIYNWAQRPQAEFHHIAASGIVVLLAVLLFFNAIAVYIRNKYQKPLS
ncbi:MAG: PstA family ABC transporter permease [Desulfobacteraceae bacterium]|jgi:phosphate transport system permease protein